MKALFLDEGRAIELASFKIQRDHFTALIYAAIERRKASTRSSDTDTQNAIKYFASLRVLATGFHTILSERFPCKDHECLSDEDCSITIELEDRLDGRISAGAVGPVGAEFKVLLGHCRVQDRQWKLVVGRITEANAASVGLDAQLAVIARNYSAAGLANRCAHPRFSIAGSLLRLADQLIIGLRAFPTLQLLGGRGRSAISVCKDSSPRKHSPPRQKCRGSASALQQKLERTTIRSRPNASASSS